MYSIINVSTKHCAIKRLRYIEVTQYLGRFIPMADRDWVQYTLYRSLRYNRGTLYPSSTVPRGHNLKIVNYYFWKWNEKPPVFLNDWYAIVPRKQCHEKQFSRKQYLCGTLCLEID